METIELVVRQRFLRFKKSSVKNLIAWNTGYIINFDFDEEWENNKTVKVVNDKGKVITDLLFSGNSVELPKITNTSHIGIGVYAGDLKSTTPLIISCSKSILDYDGVPVPPTDDVFNQIMLTLNEKADKNHTHDEYLSSANLDEVTEKTEAVLLTAQSAEKTANEALSKIDNKADKEHKHNEYADISHTHNEYANSSDMPTKVSELENDAGYISGYTETDPTVPEWAKQTNKPTYTADEVGALPDTTEIPSKVSQLENDSGYLVEHQDISGKADKSTTLEGYGIIDAYTKEEVDTQLVNIDTTATNAYLLADTALGEAGIGISEARAAQVAVDKMVVTKADKTNIITITDTTLSFEFSIFHNTEIRTGELTSISFTFGNGEYAQDFVSGMSFDSGETPTAIDYTDSGILNWVGTDCATSDGLSIFQPSANTHYDIVFYFNGVQFIGLVNGFAPATGNEAV